MHYWPDGLHIIWMTTWWFIVLGLVVSLIWFLLNTVRGPSTSSGSAEQILRRRYASGEIDTEEYESRLAELAKTDAA